MLIHLSTSADLLKSSHADFVAQPLDSAHLDSAPLSRKSTNMSEVSRILTALRDDHEQDIAEFELYKSRPAAEEALMQQLELVSPRSHAESEDEDESLQEKEEVENDHPVDGPFAFWQAFLSMLMIFSTWGANAAFGVFLNYYMTSNSFPGATQYDFALMGGVIVFLAQVLAPVSALLVRIFGQTPVLLAGVAIQTLGYFLASACTQLWQVFICQGVLVGLSFAMIFIPGTLILPTWFDKQKATAMGIAVAGAGLGGVVFSLALNKIIQQTGDQKWALRTVGFICLATSLFGSLFMRVRCPKKSKFRERWNKDFFINSFKIIFDFKVFDNYPLIVVGVWFGTALLGYVIVLYSFSSYATSVGLSHTQGSNILAILNAAQLVGRPLVGNAGDFFGRTNTSVMVCLYVAVLIFAFWLNSTTYAELIALAVMIGGMVGVGSTMSQSLAADVLEKLGRQHRLPAAWSGLNIIVSFFSLPSEVIALKLRKKSGTRTYAHTQIFTGCCYLACVLLLLVNREWLVRKTLETRRAQAEEALVARRGQHLRRESISDKNEKDDEQLLTARVERYNTLLRKGPIYFAARMFYPIRV